MKKCVKKLTNNYIFRDFKWYEKQKIPWTDQLYELSKKKKVGLSSQHVDILVKILCQMCQDDSDSITRKAVFALWNFSKTSQIFVEKCWERGVFKVLICSFLNYDPPAQMAIFALIGSFCRQCNGEDVLCLVRKLNLLDFMISCLCSMEEHLIIAVTRAMCDMIVHIKLLLDLAQKGIFDLLALIILDDLQGLMKRTFPVVAFIKRASEYGQPITHIIVRSGCLGLVSYYLHHPKIKYQRASLCTVMNIGLINLDYITSLFSPDLFSDLITFLMYPDVELKFYAANLVKRMTETSPKITNILLENGLLEALLYSLQLVHYRADPSFIALANILRNSPLTMTEHFIELKGHLILAILLHQDCCEFAVFSITQIFTDIFERGQSFNTLIANLDIYPRLIELYLRPTSSRYMRTAMRETCKQFLQHCTDWNIIKDFFVIAPSQQIAYVMKHFSEVLPFNVQEKKYFLEMNGLLKILRMQLHPDDPVKIYVDVIKACFPPDVVNYYSPEFGKSMLERVKHFTRTDKVNEASRKQWERGTNPIEEEDEN